MAGLFEGVDLRGRRLLGRAHGFPGGVGVAVGVVYAEVLEMDAVEIGGQAVDVEGDGNGGGGDVVVLVVPEEDGGGVVVDGSEGVDVWGLADAGDEEGVERDLRGAGGGYALAAHLAGHTEDVENGFIDAVGGEGAEALEVVLAFELEGPGEHAEEVDVVTGFEVEERFESGGGVDGIERAVAVVVGGIFAGGAGGAAFGIGFREDDGQRMELRVGGDESEAFVGVG